MHSARSLRKAGEVQSQAVYPRASKVERRPPDGKEDASGSPRISSLPENSSRIFPSEVGLMKESCFSAVMPVSGWNQWVKCVAPFSTAQSFIAPATTSATHGSSGAPSSMVLRSAR